MLPSSRGFVLLFLTVLSTVLSNHSVGAFLHPSKPAKKSVARSRVNYSSSGSTISAMNPAGNSGDATETMIGFRHATPEDIPRCFQIESASYPSDEAATLNSLTYRQEHAGDYFLVCVDTNDDKILGFVCATRCQEFTEESMSALHDPEGRLLAVHSVVVDPDHRRQGIANQMMARYISDIVTTETSSSSSSPIESIVCIAKEHLLGFYVRCGFAVNRPSPIVHGKELWYDLELPIPKKTNVRTQPLPGESWFCKTERFKPELSFGEIKPHLEAHTHWVTDLRENHNVCIVSGYRVDAQGKPGGGGLMFVAAKSYDEAYELVSKNDPLIVNGCVDWELNGWIGQVGRIKVE